MAFRGYLLCCAALLISSCTSRPAVLTLCSPALPASLCAGAGGDPGPPGPGGAQDDMGASLLLLWLLARLLVMVIPFWALGGALRALRNTLRVQRWWEMHDLAAPAAPGAVAEVEMEAGRGGQARAAEPAPPPQQLQAQQQQAAQQREERMEEGLGGAEDDNGSGSEASPQEPLLPAHPQRPAPPRL